MLIRAQLSREFYDRFGDTIVNEMIDLFNRIDDGARSDLRELNQQNLARIDQRAAELRAELATNVARLEARIEKLDADLRGQIAKIATSIDQRIDRALLVQTRYMIGAWGVLIASLIAGMVALRP